jgi:hypothetical protein
VFLKLAEVQSNGCWRNLYAYDLVGQTVRYFFELTPWRRILLEKLIVAQLVTRFPSFYGTPGTMFSTTFFRFLSRARCVHFTLYIPWNPFSSRAQFRPRSRKWSFLTSIFFLLKLYMPFDCSVCVLHTPLNSSSSSVQFRYSARLCEVFRNMLCCAVDLWPISPTYEREYHPSSALRDCLLNIFATAHRIRKSPRSLLEPWGCT